MAAFHATLKGLLKNISKCCPYRAKGFLHVLGGHHLFVNPGSCLSVRYPLYMGQSEQEGIRLLRTSSYWSCIWCSHLFPVYLIDLTLHTAYEHVPLTIENFIKKCAQKIS